MKLVTVIPLQKGGTKGELTYFSAKAIENGSVATIALRNKKILGLVLECVEAEENKTQIKNLDFNLKKIIDVKEKVFFRKEYIESIILCAKYFASRKNDVSIALMPRIFREEYDKLEKIKKVAVLGEENKNLKPEKLLFQAPFEERISYYKTLIRGSFAQKKSVFIVLPTEHDIDIFYKNLVRGIEKYTLFFHGGLSKKKMLEELERALSHEHPMLILATPPFLSIPREDIATIVLEHENAGAYRTVSRPNLDMRVFVELFAQKSKAKLILADTLLRFETISRKESELLPTVHALNFRPEFEGKIKIMDKGSEEKKFQILTDESLAHIDEALSKKKNVFIFSLRKGLATYTMCRDCGQTLYCGRCSAPIVLYQSADGRKRMFACNRCHRQLDPSTTCPRCYSWNLYPLGVGTDTVVERLKEVYGEKKIKIFKLDKEAVKTGAAAEELIKKFEGEKGAILVGTEMAFFYLNNKTSLSIISSFDSLWSIPNFRMGEKVINIILSLMNKTSDNLIIQTKNKNDAAVRAVLGENLLLYVREELKDRRELQYPPYARFIKIVHVGDKERTVEAKNLLRELFKEYNPEIFSGFISREKGLYVTNTLIKLLPHEWSLNELLSGSKIDENLSNKLLSLPPNWNVIVDPEDLL